MIHAELNQRPDEPEPPAYFHEALEDAERLLKYAAETGIAVDAETRSAILQARAVPPTAWTEEMAAKLLLALTTLAAMLKPVNAASLRACHSQTRATMRTYLIWSIILSAVIIPASIATFVTSNITIALRGDITKANALAVKLTTELDRTDAGTTEKVADLQEYASTIRSIYSRTGRLNQFVFPHVEVPPALIPPGKNPAEDAQFLKSKLELPVPLEDLAAARNNMTTTYQDVRHFAQSIISDISTFYGAINSCILPILYALLGTCAYLLRTFEDQMTTRTFIPSVANSARFLIAAIGGTVVGLFGAFTPKISASPLAIAFLVGYAVEVFFAFLEGLIKSFTKGARAPSSTDTTHPQKA
jgi:hypothetical protein